MSVRFDYAPDYAESPGVLIEEHLNRLNISARELARRCGRSAKMISELIAGKAPLEPETALQLERVLKVDARIWLNAEAAYRLKLTCQQEAEDLSGRSDWVHRFPLDELQRRGYIDQTSETSHRVRQLLRFFGVGSVAACNGKFEELKSVAFRHSPAFASNEGALLAWLRIGEIKAADVETIDYNRVAFIEALRKARELTRLSVAEALPKLRELCAGAGVALVVEPSLGGVALSGVSRWLSPRKALIQQTLRHKTNDHFWFTFFHEAAHILLHSRRMIFIDGAVANPEIAKLEDEANTWASNFLIPSDALTHFITRTRLTETDIEEFAREQRIAPAIVIGQLQHRKVIGFSEMHRLKERLDVAGLAALLN